MTLDRLKMHVSQSRHRLSVSVGCDVVENSLFRCTSFTSSDQNIQFDVSLLTFLGSTSMYTPSDGPLRAEEKEPPHSFSLGWSQRFG